MKQSLRLNLGQHLAMTPQLQQAIRLLQLSTTELQMEIQEALESNLMLENADDLNTGDDASDKEEVQETAPDRTEAEVPSQNAEIPAELPVDTSWEDVFDGGGPMQNLSQPAAGPDFEIQRDAGESLQDHLMWQLSMTQLSPRDTAIAIAIIDSINNDGYLTTGIEDVLQALGEEAAEDEDNDATYQADEVVAVLHQLQNFDPPGVCARDPQECLLIQLRQLHSDTPWRSEALQLVERHLQLLASQEHAKLKQQLKLNVDDLAKVISLVRSMNPRPGSSIDKVKPQYVAPDVFVNKQKEGWVVSLNLESIPKIRVNAEYANLVKRADNSDSNSYLRNHLQEARWFLKSIQSRNETLFKVATCIVEYQEGFFEHGEELMKPLVLRHIADKVGMHESTISRVTTQKYMHTPRGVFEFKYFFSSHVSTDTGGECSATAIRAFIKKLVDAELPAKPLSDSKIALVLADQGITVARRTVAKYREALSIPSSSERKRLI